MQLSNATVLIDLTRQVKQSLSSAAPAYLAAA